MPAPSACCASAVAMPVSPRADASPGRPRSFARSPAGPRHRGLDHVVGRDRRRVPYAPRLEVGDGGQPVLRPAWPRPRRGLARGVAHRAHARTVGPRNEKPDDVTELKEKTLCRLGRLMAFRTVRAPTERRAASAKTHSLQRADDLRRVGGDRQRRDAGGGGPWKLQSSMRRRGPIGREPRRSPCPPGPRPPSGPRIVGRSPWHRSEAGRPAGRGPDVERQAPRGPRSTHDAGRHGPARPASGAAKHPGGTIPVAFMRAQSR